MELYNTTFFADMFRIVHRYELFAVVVTYASVLYFPKWRWLKGMGVLVITGALGVVVRDAALHNQDICIEQNRKLSDQEKLDAAVREVIRNYPPTIIRHTFESTIGVQSSHTLSPAKHPILYKDLNEFYELNPGCCQLTDTRDKEEGRIGFYARVRWQYSVFANVIYKVKYMDEINVMREITDERTIPISQCATILEHKNYFED